jgi:undecaprenyl-diphosphatase
MHSLFVKFDRFFGLAIKKLPKKLLTVMLSATFIGTPIILIIVAVIVAILGYFKHLPNIEMAELLALTAFAGNTVLKTILHRVRPDTMYVQHMKIKSYSFPSGHAFGSVVIYGLLVFISFTDILHPWNYIISSAIAGLILLIGVSRVYLEAHFPSDIVAGWILGGLCLILIIIIVKP